MVESPSVDHMGQIMTQISMLHRVTNDSQSGLTRGNCSCHDHHHSVEADHMEHNLIEHGVDD